jgi:hypothetical protein
MYGKKETTLLEYDLHRMRLRFWLSERYRSWPEPLKTLSNQEYEAEAPISLDSYEALRDQLETIIQRMKNIYIRDIASKKDYFLIEINLDTNSPEIRFKDQFQPHTSTLLAAFNRNLKSIIDPRICEDCLRSIHAICRFYDETRAEAVVTVIQKCASSSQGIAYWYDKVEAEPPLRLAFMLKEIIKFEDYRLELDLGQAVLVVHD